MGELADYGIDLDMLRRMYDEWCRAATKSDLERRYLNKPVSHGKLFTALVREHLGIETERISRQSERIAELEREVARLKRLLRMNGLDPDGGGLA